MKGAADRLRRERDDRIEQAWLTATLSRAKEIPSLQKLLTPKKVRKMSREELQIMFDALAASWRATMQ